MSLIGLELADKYYVFSLKNLQKTEILSTFAVMILLIEFF